MKGRRMLVGAWCTSYTVPPMGSPAARAINCGTRTSTRLTRLLRMVSGSDNALAALVPEKHRVYLPAVFRNSE